MTGVALALGASLAWGVSDYLAGVSARRAGALAVSLVSQVISVVLAAAWVAASGDPAPDGETIALSVAAGMAIIVGLGGFYKAMALAPMSIVAPLMATGVVVPVLAGIVAGERPAAVQAAGIVLATAGVALAVRRPGRLGGPAADPRAGIALAVVGAAGGGVFMWLMAPASEESVAWALLVARGAAMPVFLAAVVARGVPVGAALATRVAAAEMVTVGVLAFAAAALYAGATQHGLLSLVSVLGSLYPAVTVLLAWRLIGERMDAARWAGVVAVMAGVVLIAAG